MIKPDNKKVSKEFLNYLKSTPSISESKPQPFKEKQAMIDLYPKHEGYNGPIEGDFSKIGQTYVLENDKLKKKSLFDTKVRAIQVHNQKYEEIEEPQDVEVIKEIAKLEYLQKKGYLKPQEAQRLQQLRGSKLAPEFVEVMPIPEKKNLKSIQGKNIANEMMPFEIDPENMDPNMYYQDPYMPQKSKLGGQMYNPQFGHPMNYSYQTQFDQKPQYFQQGHPMNWNQGMHPNHFDPRQTGYY